MNQLLRAAALCAAFWGATAFLAPVPAEPTPECITGHQVHLPSPFSPDGAEGAWLPATALLGNTLADSAGVASLSINLLGEPDSLLRDSLWLTCADVGTVVVELRAIDALGQVGRCLAGVQVLDEQTLCPTDFFGFFGTVTAWWGEPVAGAQVALSAGATAVAETGPEGAYALYEPPQAGLDYELRPFWGAGPLNGVSTLDMVRIGQHILGTVPLESPYQRIAADVNGSGVITLLDLIRLRRLVLGQEVSLGEVPSWRFVPAGHVFEEGGTGVPDFPEALSLSGLSTVADSWAQDFVAVKVGDVNGDADPVLQP